METIDRKTLTTSRSFQYTYYTSPSTPSNKKQPALLFCHGFPDSSFLWKSVLTHLAKNGTLENHKVIVPDMLGYAETSKPLTPASYNYSDMSNDLIEILDAESVTQVIAIGHDWGAIMAQRLYAFHSDRVARLVLLNVAYHQPAKPEDPKIDLQAMNQMLEATFGAPLWTYWEFFTAEDGPKLMQENLERVYEAQHGDVEDWGWKMFCVPGAWREYVSGTSEYGVVPLKPYAQDRKWKTAFMRQFERDWFEAPVMWYKAMMENVQYDVEVGIPLEKHTVMCPVLFVGCTGDGNNRVEFIEIPRVNGLLPDLEVKVLDCGHWSPMERPGEVAGFISDFVGRDLKTE